jgi:hypothetical protein
MVNVRKSNARQKINLDWQSAVLQEEHADTVGEPCRVGVQELPAQQVQLQLGGAEPVWQVLLPM